MQEKKQKTHVQNEQKYNASEVEKKWQEVWDKSKTFQPDLDHAQNPFYNLMMFPYPSAEGMHVGNMYAFTGSDIYGRFKRMQGHSVFEPMGLDGFGIHSENYALKIGKHPMDQAEISQKNFYRQLKATGNAFDWSRKVETYDKEYYKWTQWLFTELFKAGFAYRKKAPVNFCPSCKTVLADEQVIDGTCERCGTHVEKKALQQWFFRITEYAEKLLQNIPKLDWAENVKIAQTAWIGKSEGAKIVFKIKRLEQIIEVFTTRPDTLYGTTFLVVSPEHPFIKEILAHPSLLSKEKKEEIEEYVKKAKLKSEQERTEQGKEKNGVNSSAYAINPINNQQIPVWIADYVLMGYGTGAVMGVPAHDERDFEFAKKYNLKIQPVISIKNMPYRSYLMGGESISDEKLQEIGVQIVERTESAARKIEILPKKLEAYKQLIREKLTPGYWNEVVGEEVWFLFKGTNEEIKEHFLTDDNSDEIAELCAQFNKEPIEKTKNMWLYLAQNDWYKPYIVTKSGYLVRSDLWNDLKVPEQISTIVKSLEEKGIGQRQVNYHLRDWLISRQRYWGAPIPMIYCSNCAQEGLSWFNTEGEKLEKNKASLKDMEGWYPVSQEELPVILPRIEDYKPLGTGKAPLASHPEFYKTKCPHCGFDAQRETDVSDTFLDSSWYFLRYLATERNDIPFPSQKFDEENKDPKSQIAQRARWLPVTMYIGGAEHSVLHLLYARFITMVLSDLGYISFEEPFMKFYAHGLLIKEGAKMSKSKGNVVVPDAYIKKFGSDTLRTYLMFLGPFNAGGDFYDTGIEGIYKFLKRVWVMMTTKSIVSTQESVSAKKNMHQTIKSVTEDMQQLRFNTAIAHMMSYYNNLSKQESLSRQSAEVFLKLLAPFAPHITEELWQRLFSKTDHKTSSFQSIHLESWPTYEKSYLTLDTALIVIQVNGKLRDNIVIKSSEIKEQSRVEQMAKESEKVKKYLEGKEIRKTIYIEGKVINFVV